MTKLTLLKGDFASKLALSLALQPIDGDIIVAYVNGEFTIKYLSLSHKDEGYIELKPANPNYSPIRIDADDNFRVWGVVVWTIKQWRR